MMRSCYTAKMRWFKGLPIESDIQWYFTDDNAPFLPFKSVYTSLDFIDASERVDDHVNIGEIPGTRRYSKGQRNRAFKHQRFCGKVTDFAGSGRPLATPMQYDMFGVPVCCNATQSSGQDVTIGVNGEQLAFSVGGNNYISDNFGGIMQASAFPYTVLSNLLPEGNINPPWTVDLLYSDPGQPETLSDCVLCDFPGYQQQPYAGYIVNGDPTGFPQMLIPCGPFHFEAAADPTGSKNYIAGYVVCDASGNVLFFDLASDSIPLLAAGDYVDLTFNLAQGFDYV